MKQKNSNFSALTIDQKMFTMGSLLLSVFQNKNLSMMKRVGLLLSLGDFDADKHHCKVILKGKMHE